MTLEELNDALVSRLTRDGSNRITGPDVLQSTQLIVSYFATQLSDIVPDWSPDKIFQTDGTDDGKYCKFPDTTGKKRIFLTKIDDNTNNQPPSNPTIEENDQWEEVSASASSAIQEWSPGLYGPGIIIVYHNHSVNGRGLYILLEPVRPFNSVNIEAEDTTWALLGGVEHYKGTFLSLEDLQAEVPVGKPGDWAIVDPGTGTDAKEYNWDNDDAQWVEGGPGVKGPDSAFDNEILISDGDTGKKLKESGITIGDIFGSIEQAVSNIPYKPSMDVCLDGALPAFTAFPSGIGGRTVLQANANGYFPTTDGVMNDATHFISSVLVRGLTGPNAKYNGLYNLYGGSLSTKWTLTRTIETQPIYGGIIGYLDLMRVEIKRGTVNAGKTFQQKNLGVTIDVNDQDWQEVTSGGGSLTLLDVLTFGADANGIQITELGGFANSVNDFNGSAPNYSLTIDTALSMLSTNGDVYIDGFNSTALQSSNGGLYMAGLTEIVIGQGIEPVSLILPFAVNEGDIFFQGAGSRVDALPKGSGNQVVGLVAGSLAWKQLVFSDINMTSGSLLGRSTAGTGAIQTIAAGDGIDLAAGNLNLGGEIANNISFSVPSNVLKAVSFGDYIDLFLSGANSKFRVGFGGTEVSAIQFKTQSYVMQVGRNGLMTNINTLSIGDGLIFTAAAGDATTNDGRGVNLRSGVAHNGAGTNGKGGDITLETNAGFGTGLGGDILLNLATGGMIKINTPASAVTSTTITHHLKVRLGGDDYYLCLKTAP
jgi:hypothetical protein